MTTRADRLGSAFDCCPARRLPDFGLTRKSAISGDIVRDIRNSGFRDLVENSCGGVSSGIPAARLLPSPRRVLDAAAGKKRGPGTGRFRRPAGVRARESPRPQTARFRADAKICDVRRHCRGSPEIGISGSRQEVIGGGLLESGGAFSDVSAACFLAGFRRKRGPEIDRLRRLAGVQV